MDFWKPQNELILYSSFQHENDTFLNFKFMDIEYKNKL
jgi:hypothetical protein